MSNEILPQSAVNAISLQPRDITPGTVNTAVAISQIAWESGAFGAASPAQAAMVMLKAYELGFPMTAANEFLEVIDSRAQLKPLGAMAIMRAHPEIIRSVTVEDLFDPNGKYYGCRCTIERYEAGRVVSYSKQFTLQDAEMAGLVKPKGNWEKYPQQMCQWRAVGFCADIACPDLLSGMTGLLKRGELAEDPGDYAFDATPITIEPAAAAQTAKSGMTLQELTGLHDLADILAVTGGVMPHTPEECEAVHAKLAEGEQK